MRRTKFNNQRPVVGFTGTRFGLTDSQKLLLTSHLRELNPAEFHHGDCIGADEQAHDIALELEIPVVLHPPEKIDLRAFCKGATRTMKPLPYLKRNWEIAKAATEIVGCPNESVERKRSGTWSTIRYAKAQQKLITILYPDGITYKGYK